MYLTKQELQDRKSSSVLRAQQGVSLINDEAVMQGFIAKGIPAQNILPRDNVFTFNGWKELGRMVKKGEHGVKLTVIIAIKKTDKAGNETVSTWPKTTTVFHISQTEPLAQKPEVPEQALSFSVDRFTASGITEGPLTLTACASDLCLPVGSFPNQLVIPGIGNSLPFSIKTTNADFVAYRQDLGCVTATIFND